MQFFSSSVANLYQTSDWKNQCIELPSAWGHWLSHVPPCGLRTWEPIKSLNQSIPFNAVRHYWREMIFYDSEFQCWNNIRLCIFTAHEKSKFLSLQKITKRLLNKEKKRMKIFNEAIVCAKWKKDNQVVALSDRITSSPPRSMNSKSRQKWGVFKLYKLPNFHFVWEYSWTSLYAIDRDQKIRLTYNDFTYKKTKNDCILGDKFQINGQFAIADTWICR